jgi:simple sugar transport system permease protein
LSPTRSDFAAVRLPALVQGVGVPLAAVMLAGAVGAFILAASGADPARAYGALAQGALGDFGALTRTLQKATPLIFNGLAVALAFKAGLFNIGTQGQLLAGAIAAAAVGAGFAALPAGLHLSAALLAGGLAGGAWGWIQGALRAYTGAHEVITGIMFNYLAINLTDFLAAGPLRDPTPGNILARTSPVAESARLAGIGALPGGFLMALAGALAVWWIVGRTTPGFALRTVGENSHAARYAGIRTRRVIVLSMLFSGILAAFGGAVETLGVVYRFQPGFNVGLGFEGITIALLGRTHPLGVVPAALLVGAMKAGAGHMQFEAGVDTHIVDVILALILFFVAADRVLAKILPGRGAGPRVPALTAGWGRQ